MEPKCEYHKDCVAPVVAKIGLPGEKAIWTCQEGFWQWRQSKGESAS